MRVAVLTQYFPTSHQPWAGHSAYQTLRMLAQHCDLKVFYPDATYPQQLSRMAKLRRASDPGYRPDGVDVQYIPYTALPVISRPLNGRSAARALLPAMRQYQPDIILSYVVYPDGYAATLIGRTLKVPVVLTAIGSDLNRISDAACAYLTRKALRTAAHTITVSGDLLKTARRLGAPPERSSAILNGCDPLVFHPRDRAAARTLLGLPQDTEIITYVGRYDVRKGLRELVEAMVQLQRIRPHVHCYLVGEGSDGDQLRTLIQSSNAAEYVHLIPACNTAMVAQWMAASTLFTLPSYKEGCPNVVIEALASGRPVVSTLVGGIPELVDANSGMLIAPHDAAQLAKALNEVLSRTWDAAELSARHSRGWGDVADDVEAVLRETLAK